MTLGPFYVIKRLGDTNYLALLNDFYHVTHYINGGYMLPYLNWVFLLNKEDFYKLVEGLGLEAIKDKKFELVSLMTFLNYRAAGEVRNIEPDEMRRIISKTKLTDDVQDNITALIKNFDKNYNKSNDLVEDMINMFDKNATHTDIYYICYNIISYVSSSIDYDYTTDSLFYLASEYMEGFIEDVKLKLPYSMDKLCKHFDVPPSTNLPTLITYSTIHTQINLIKTDMPDSVKLVELVNYTDGQINLSVQDKLYTDRYDMLTAILNP